MRQKELIDIYILEILAERASKEKKMYQKDIMRYLEVDYNLQVSRKTLGTYISCLRDNGYIEGERGLYGIYQFSKFTDNQLRVLIDSILYSQHIPEQEARDLITDLRKLSPIGLKNKVRNISYVKAFKRTKNENLYVVLDNVDQAIQENKKIEITTCRYDEKGKLQEVGTSTIDPYYIVVSNSRYYIICYAGRENQLESRRIDRISKVEILNEKRKPLKEVTKPKPDFNLGEYMKEHVYMFSGESVFIEIKMHKDHIGFFIDSFGHDFTTRKAEEDDDHIIVRTKNNENATYYWALQYGGLVEILKPQSLRDKIKTGLKDILKKYAKDFNENSHGQ